MEKGLAPPKEAAKRKAKLQAKAILKYFGRQEQKVLVPAAPKEEASHESKSESAYFDWIRNL